jgi:hypothetical protein
MADPTTPVPTYQSSEDAFNHITDIPTLPPPTPQAAPTPMGEVQVLSPTGELGTIPGEQMQSAIAEGYKQASPEDVANYHLQKEYGTPGQQLATFGEGVANAATFGGFTALEQAAGVPEEGLRARPEANPISNLAGQFTGLVGSSLLGTGEGAAVEMAGKAAAKAVGLAAPTTFLAKVGSAAVKAAAENALVAGGDEASKMFAGDPNQSAQTALTDVGLSALIGAGAGGMFGTVAPLWNATIGHKVGGALKALTDRAGGIEGRVETPMSEAIAKTGMDLAPEMRAGLEGDPAMQSTFNTLSQSPTSKGLALKGVKEAAEQQMGEGVSTALGKAPGEIPEAFDKYNSGKTAGTTLSEEFAAGTDPLSAEFEAKKASLKGRDLDPSIADRSEQSAKAISSAQDFADKTAAAAQKDLDRATKAAVKAQTSGDGAGAIQAAQDVAEKQEALKDALTQGKLALQGAQKAASSPGTMDAIREELDRIPSILEASVSPSSDIMREVDRVRKELPLQKTLNNLSDYIKQVGNNMIKGKDNGSMIKVGLDIQDLMRRHEADLIGRHIGSEEGVEALNKFNQLRQAYAARGRLKSQLDAALHLKGDSISGYAKRIAEAATSDGEGMWNKLNGKGDAATLELLQKNFPKTAEAVRQGRLSEILSKAKTGDKINPYNIMDSINKLSPQLKSFVVPGEMAGKVDGYNTILNHLKAMPKNYSNTASTLDAMWSGMPAAAVAIVGALTGHGMAGLALAPFARMLGREAPDALKLAMLKFMGSSAPIDAGAFKTTLEFAKATIAGENLLSRATSNIFKAGREVLPQSAIPSESDRTKLDKSLKEYQKNPEKMASIGGNIGHYMPEHATSIVATGTNAIQTLNSLRPGTKQMAPLDRPQKPSPVQQAAYNRALDIAQQPLMVLHHLNNGTLNSQDVMLVQKLYPDLYTRIQQKVTEQLAKATSEDGNTIPYATRMGLSKLMGQPLDSTLTPMGIMSAQPQPSQQPPQGPQAPVKHKTAALTKMSSHYETSAQASEADNNSRET